ncbi:MAG: competence type IV pilus major pilin ComGC [Syntrophomonadales bacterium]
MSDFHRIIRVWKERQGFTVLELLAVFALLAIIAALVAPKYTAVVHESKVKACQSNIEMLTKAAEMYKEVNGDTAQLTVKTLLDAEYINEYVYCPVGDGSHQDITYLVKPSRVESELIHATSGSGSIVAYLYKVLIIV